MRSLIFLIFIFCSACARPDYISKEEFSNSNDSFQENNSVEFPETKIRPLLQWKETPQSSGAQEFSLTLTGNIEQFDDLTIVLWMPSMGHGSAPVKIEKISGTQYHVTHVYFIMPGDWEVRIVLKKSDTVIDQLFIPLMIP